MPQAPNPHLHSKAGVRKRVLMWWGDNDDGDQGSSPPSWWQRKSRRLSSSWSAKRILGFSGAQLSSSNQYNQDGHGKPQVYFVDNIDDDEKNKIDKGRVFQVMNTCPRLVIERGLMLVH